MDDVRIIRASLAFLLGMFLASFATDVFNALAHAVQ